MKFHQNIKHKKGLKNKGGNIRRLTHFNSNILPINYEK